MPGFVFSTFSKIPAGSRLRLRLAPPPAPLGSWAMSGTKRRGVDPLVTVHTAEFEDGDVEFLLRDSGQYEIRSNMRRVRSDGRKHFVELTVVVVNAAGGAIGAPFIGTLELDADRTAAYAKFEVEVL